ncbi:MAG: restriction endonuclease [Chthonomonadaceae bacterium]|jgi:5-methylcytosine-specific restriction endonuclease McrA|nr:restriction endonuclease [Chthonomonadaceae bacterium]
MSNFVLVLDKNQVPQNPVHPGTARLLLKEGKAAVLRLFPFVIILKEAVEDAPTTPLVVKIDPGSKTTGIAVVQGDKVVWAAELSHKGQAIRKALQGRSTLRKGRRNRKTRYRKPRFLNRTRPKGWLAPSLLHRVQTVQTWVQKLCRYAPVTGIAQELVKFDTQAMENPEISGVEYQQGTLLGYEVREYLLEKWGRKCAYCDKQDAPLEVDHILPKFRGGSNRISNLCLACHECNQKKNNRCVQEFLKDKPAVLARLLKQAKSPLKDAAAINATRWKLLQILNATGLPVETGSGGRTKWNRTRFGLEKTHWLDAACVGEVETLTLKVSLPLLIQCVGHGNRQVCRTDKYGFPSRHKSRRNLHFGFQTGDIVKAVVTKGKKIGVHIGKVACRATGSFNISTPMGLMQGVSHRFCRLLHHKDGYAYTQRSGSV